MQLIKRYITKTHLSNEKFQFYKDYQHLAPVRQSVFFTLSKISLKNHFQNILNRAKTEMKLAGKENEIAIYNLFFKFC